ncbi:hypothetical protein [Microbacterium sp. CFBP9034]|uniref:hypothetical protein n=1 Tax=Microbacterium sp. CFBP9034 TaxID=3096540 RepID=UPI002A6A13C8|nr:hypothetical protein [Microbacterium sp. CFBP9034]MDY0910870.1 hypothetical protein [Microbacterium sp. CFBP9034]
MRDRAGAAGELASLRAQLERVQGRRLDAPVLPVHPALAALLPGGGLRPGAAYSLSRSTSLLLALLAQPSQAGSWCGVVGMPRLGVEAAERLGVDLSRLVLIPEPGPRWLAVTATVSEVLPVVAVRPAGRAPDGEVARLAARLRDRGAVLLVQGPWPQAEAVLELDAPDWTGVGRGHGYLAGREVTVTASSRRWPRARRSRLLLPDANGAVAAIAEPVPALTAVPDSPASGEWGAEPVYAPLEARAVG